MEFYSSHFCLYTYSLMQLAPQDLVPYSGMSSCFRKEVIQKLKRNLLLALGTVMRVFTHSVTNILWMLHWDWIRKKINIVIFLLSVILFFFSPKSLIHLFSPCLLSLILCQCISVTFNT